MQGRSALVTGGNRGIGGSIASGLLKSGIAVSSVSRTGGAPAGVDDYTGDLSEPEQILHVMQSLEDVKGIPDIVVFNSGITDASLAVSPSDDRLKVVEVNLLATWTILEKVLPAMLAKRWGRLIFVGSVLGFTGSPGQSAYGATKSAMVGLSRSLSWEYGARGITANVVSPGLINTEMTQSLAPSRLQWYVDSTPMKRSGEATDVANAVQFLASDQASFITGAVLPVSGGLGMGM